MNAICGLNSLCFGFVGAIVWLQSWWRRRVSSYPSWLQFVVAIVVAMLVAIVVAVFGRTIWNWIMSKISPETFRKVANFVKNLPTPVKVIGGILAAAAIIPFALPG